MKGKRRISVEEALSIGTQLKVDWTKIALEQLRHGVEVELEHGLHDPEAIVTHKDLLLMGNIAWAHLKEIRDYYTWFERLQPRAKNQPESIG
jgi:hypothetical protein